MVWDGVPVLVSVARVVPWRAVIVTTDAAGKPDTAHVNVQDLPMKQPPAGPASEVVMLTTVTRTVAEEVRPVVSVTVKLKSWEPADKPVTVVTAAEGEVTTPAPVAAHANVNEPPVRDTDEAAVNVTVSPRTTATLGAIRTGGS